MSVWAISRPRKRIVSDIDPEQSIVSTKAVRCLRVMLCVYMG